MINHSILDGLFLSHAYLVSFYISIISKGTSYFFACIKKIFLPKQAHKIVTWINIDQFSLAFKSKRIILLYCLFNTTVISLIKNNKNSHLFSFTGRLEVESSHWLSKINGLTCDSHRKHLLVGKTIPFQNLSLLSCFFLCGSAKGLGFIFLSKVKMHTNIMHFYSFTFHVLFKSRFVSA